MWKRFAENRIVLVASLVVSVFMVPWSVYHGILTLTGNEQYRVLTAFGWFVLAVYGVLNTRTLWHRLRGA